MWWLKSAVMMLTHPVEVGVVVKRRRERIPAAAVLIPLLLMAALRIAAVYFTNFTVSSVLPRNASLALELAFAVLPVLLWSISSYAFMTVMGGESTIRETLLLSTYCFMPYIALTPWLIGLSRLLSYEEAGFYTALHGMVWLWVALLLFLSFKESNNLTMRRAVLFAALILLVMLLVAGVALLAFALVSQIVLFVQEVVSELSFYSLIT